MTDPDRWALLNESEREFLRAGIEYRDASFSGRERHIMHAAAAALALTDSATAPGVIEMGARWHVVEAIFPAGNKLLLLDGSIILTACRRGIMLGDDYTNGLDAGGPIANLLRASGRFVVGEVRNG